MYKVISTSPTFGKFSKEPIALLEENNCEVTILSDEIIKNHTLLAKALEEADAYIVGFEKVTESLIENTDRLKVVAKHGVGVDNIDINSLNKHKIKLVYAPGGNKHAVAEFVIGLLLNANRSIGKSFNDVKNGDWPKLIGTDLRNKKLGVIGTGNIGKEVIKIAKGFQMDVLAFDLYPDYAFQEEYKFAYTDFTSILKQADFITIHTVLNDSSKTLIGESELNLMKESAFLVNTARGGIVDENALFNALSKNIIAGAALDVFEQEPIANSPLLLLPNFTATPPIAGYSYGALYQTGMITAENILNVLTGKKAEYEYNS